ncbi:uncharacterized protein MONBRDRAFT_29499, partial [Monosiga brevicollis MX1]
MAAAGPEIVLAARSSDGISLTPGVEGSPSFLTKHNDCKCMTFSQAGDILAWCDGTNVLVHQVSTGVKLCEIPRPRTVDLVLSPRQTYIALWENYAVRDDKGEDNFTVFRIKDGQLLTSCVAKAYSNWKPQWTADERLFVRMTTNTLYCHPGDNPSAPPGEGVLRFAAFQPGKKGAPSAARVYSEPNFQNPIANKSFYKADKVDFYWNKSGSAVLVSTQTDTDTSGKSYYGETNLYYINSRDGDSMTVSLDKGGPIHDCHWAPNGKEFAVCFGVIPSKVCLFNHRCDVIKDYGTGPRNFLRYSPHGNILCIAGFGNLQGDLEFWSREDHKLMTRAKAWDTTYFEWAPDSRHVITATTAPRLKVDNGYKIWHYAKGLVNEVKFDKELYQVQWQPAPEGKFPKRSLSPISDTARKATESSAKKQVYRPPGARNRPAPPKLHDEPKAAADTANLSKTALKNAKKRAAKKKAAEEATAAPAAAPAPTASASAAPEAQADTSKK